MLSDLHQDESGEGQEEQDDNMGAVWDAAGDSVHDGECFSVCCFLGEEFSKGMRGVSSVAEIMEVSNK